MKEDPLAYYNKEETVTISKKDYDELLADSNHLQELFALGVDNWEGYRPAHDEDED